MKKIVFLCSGNTSRSPIAERIFKRMVRNVEVLSAGFSTYSGEPADANTIIVCKRHGINLTDFKTTNVSDIDFNEVDLVLTATVDNRNKIKKFYPHIDAYTLREYGGFHDDLDIEDPSDGGLGDYVVCYFEIMEALEKILEVHGGFEVIM